jgi:hypothetical protein
LLELQAGMLQEANLMTVRFVAISNTGSK